MLHQHRVKATIYVSMKPSSSIQSTKPFSSIQSTKPSPPFNPRSYPKSSKHRVLRASTPQALVLSGKRCEGTNAGVHSTMKLYLPVTLAIMTHTALVFGLKCSSDCAACWKDNTPGVDIKWACDDQQCGDACPAGYNSPHCATKRRCL